MLSNTITASSLIAKHCIIQEGFASEVRASWLIRIYFMSFFIVMLVILQVVISLIVDEFKFKLVNMAKELELVCSEHDKPFKDCHCEGCEYLGYLIAWFLT